MLARLPDLHASDQEGPDLCDAKPPDSGIHGWRSDLRCVGPRLRCECQHNSSV